MRPSLQALINELAKPLLKPKYRLYVSEEVALPQHIELRELPKPGRRYTLSAIDAASATLHVPAGEVTVVAGVMCGVNSVRVYPSFRVGVFRSEMPSLAAPIEGDLDFVLNKYVKVGLKYVNDPDLPEGALSNDLRIYVETHLLRQALKCRCAGDVLLVDGPATYPLTHPLEGSVWNAELGGLNEDRVEAMRELVKAGIAPVCLVKRVWRSRHLVRVAGLSWNLTDVQAMLKLLKGRLPGRPTLIGPWMVSAMGDAPERLMAYIIAPSAGTSAYAIFRVEIIREAAELLGGRLEEILSQLAYSPVTYGTYVPYRLHLADKLSKEVASRNASVLEALLRLNGVPLLYGGARVE